MKLTITFISLVFSSSLMFGQILDRTEQRAKNKTNQRIDNKIDNGIDKGLNAVEGLFSKKKNSKDSKGKDAETTDENQNESAANQAETAKAMSIFGGEAKVEDSYEFDHNVLLNIETYDKKGKQQDPMDMRMYFTDDKPTFGMDIKVEGSESIIIYDMESYQIVSLINNDGQKIGTAMKLNPEKFDDTRKDQSDGDGADYKFVKTGNTKVISGFHCDEYKMESSENDPDMSYTYWVTDETEGNWMQYMANMGSSNKSMSKNFEIPENYPEGAMIQMISASTKNQQKSIMTVTEFNKNQKKKFSTGGYQFMNIPAMGGK